MQRCNHEYQLDAYQRLEFEIDLRPNGKEELVMRYVQRHIRSGDERRILR